MTSHDLYMVTAVGIPKTALRLSGIGSSLREAIAIATRKAYDYPRSASELEIEVRSDEGPKRR